MKRTLALLLALTVAFCALALTGCAKADDSDLEATLATVNGEIIKRNEVTDIYDMYASYYASYYSEADYPDFYSGLKTDILDSLISDLLVKQQAKAAGYLEYTDEARTAAKKYVEDAIEEEIKTKADELQKIDSAAAQHDAAYYYNMAKEKVEDTMRTNGETLETRIDDKLETDALTAFKEEKLKDAKALDADILVKYDELMRAQKEKYIGDNNTNDYSAFVTDYNGGATTFVYYLDGYSLVQRILVAYDTDNADKVSAAAKEVTTAQTALDKLKDELSKLTSETEKAAKQTEIDAAQKTLDEKKAAYEAALNTAKEANKEKAQAVLDSVKGKDEAGFIAVMLEKTDDTTMNTEEAAKKGVLAGNSDGLVTSVHDAAVKLEKDGDISELVAADNGFYILRRMSGITAGEVAEADVHETIKQTLTDEKRTTEWDNLIAGWRSSGKVSIDSKWLGNYSYS